ncbi:MAG TPA: hypothetical protein VI136_22395 [Verrucomicrobiae bacterium]
MNIPPEYDRGSLWLTGRSHAHPEVFDGSPVSLEYLRVSLGNVPEAERQRVRWALEQYYGQDTAGMIWIVDAVRKLTDVTA